MPFLAPYRTQLACRQPILYQERREFTISPSSMLSNPQICISKYYPRDPRLLLLLLTAPKCGLSPKNPGGLSVPPTEGEDYGVFGFCLLLFSLAFRVHGTFAGAEDF